MTAAPPITVHVPVPGGGRPYLWMTFVRLKIGM